MDERDKEAAMRNRLNRGSYPRVGSRIEAFNPEATGAWVRWRRVGTCALRGDRASNVRR